MPLAEIRGRVCNWRPVSSLVLQLSLVLQSRRQIQAGSSLGGK